MPVLEENGRANYYSDCVACQPFCITLLVTVIEAYGSHFNLLFLFFCQALSHHAKGGFLKMNAWTSYILCLCLKAYLLGLKHAVLSTVWKEG